MKITLYNYTYKLKKTTKDEYYIARSFSNRGYKKWQLGLLKNRSGIISFNK